ncbi:MAG: PPA1309 family protein [Actinomycetota bacterium]|nr:PPA1309 family protein [Actinomycetota bacterium]
MNHSTEQPSDWSSTLPGVVREVEDFLAGFGWDQPPQLFALVPTADLLAAEPGLASSLPEGGGLTPVAQDPLDDTDVAAALEEICWPDGVSGCAFTQDIVVLPPAAEAELDDAVAAADARPEAELDQVAVRFAHSHPYRREARLVVGVLRSGGYCCLLRVRGVADQPDEFVEHPDLAPNMVTALMRTLES